MLGDRSALIAIYGIVVLGLVWLVWKLLLDNKPEESRLRAVSQRRQQLQAQALETPGRRARAKEKDKKKQIGAIKRIVVAMKLQKKPGAVATSQDSEMRLKLLRAGYRSRDAFAVFLFLQVAMACGGGFLAFFYAAASGLFQIKAAYGVLAILAGLAFGWILPGILLKMQGSSRRKTLQKAMPDALDLLVICAEAGLSLDSALDRVSREMAGSNPELAEEFGLTGVELGLLPERTRALQNLIDRVELQGVMSLVNTLIQTERYGTPLAQALRVLASEMRDERMMKAEEKAARLPAVLTVPMILFILPTLFIVIIGPAAIKVMAAMGK